MHSSVCAPATTSRPTPSSDSTVSSVVSSNESGYAFCTCGSATSGLSSGTMRHGSVPCSRCSLLCWTQTTGTSALRAFSTRSDTFATTVSRSCPSATTPVCTSTTSSAVLGRFSSVAMPSSIPYERHLTPAPMIADLHAHYPMHVVTDVEPGTAVGLMTEAGARPRLADKVRALILRVAMRLGSDKDYWSGHRISVPYMQEGGVGLVLSVLYRPFE